MSAGTGGRKGLAQRWGVSPIVLRNLSRTMQQRIMADTLNKVAKGLGTTAVDLLRELAA